MPTDFSPIFVSEAVNMATSMSLLLFQRSMGLLLARMRDMDGEGSAKAESDARTICARLSVLSLRNHGGQLNNCGIRQTRPCIVM